MENKNKTGLGGSLLLRKTEPTAPQTPPTVPPPEVASMPPVEPQPVQESPENVSTPSMPRNLKSRQRTSKKGKKPLVLRDQCTFYISHEVNERLHLVSGIEGRDRSEIVSDLLQKHLPTYRIERQE